MRRILIVEDDEDLATMLKMLLERYGAAVWLASSLAEAQSLGAAAVGCDLALLDVQLGAGVPNGVDVHRWLADQGFRGETVFFTGHASSHPAVMAASLTPGARIMAKPASLAELARLAEPS